MRAAEEKPKPNSDRLREFRDSGLPSLEQQLFSTAPVYKNLDTVLLTDSLAKCKTRWEKIIPTCRRCLQGKTPGRCRERLDREYETR